MGLQAVVTQVANPKACESTSRAVRRNSDCEAAAFCLGEQFDWCASVTVALPALALRICPLFLASPLLLHVGLPPVPNIVCRCRPSRMTIEFQLARRRFVWPTCFPLTTSPFVGSGPA